jgi:hypothetical protein
MFFLAASVTLFSAFLFLFNSLLKSVCKITSFICFVYLQDWQPPFTLNVEKLRFTPRVQRINELEVCNKNFTEII